MQAICSWVLLLSLAPAIYPNGPVQDDQRVITSCQNFVQSFYDWYVKRPDWPRALKYRPSAFGPEISHLLKEDYQAQATTTEGIAGLDWDPTLSGNDRPPGERYVVDRVTMTKEGRCRAEMSSTYLGKKSEKAVVAADLVNHFGQWPQY